ncbi:MAG TPA: hypothetical protein VMJ10_16295 [Kofleriaceae bacterium]|nr:hypothetical protein [Kofleriaceae bacterium]
MRVQPLVLVALAACGRVDFDSGRDAARANGSADAASDADAGSNVVANRAFVTSSLQAAGSLGGFAGADALCTSLANTAGLAGSFRAWVSTSTTDAIDRFTSVRGWVRPDGRPVADLPADLAGAMRYPLRLDESGHDVGDQSAYAATATYSDGTALDTCSNLTSTSGKVNAGLPWVTGLQWTSSTQLSCGASLRMYCFGVDLDVPLEIVPAVGRRAFVSTTQFTPTSGLASADVACTADATNAGLAGTFRALLPDTGSAASRFDATGTPWIRVDGIALADTAADFFAGTVLAPLDVTAAGAYTEVLPITGYGTPLDAPDPAYDCNGWTSAAGGLSQGLSSASGADAFNYTTNPCTTIAPVYCLEQ